MIAKNENYMRVEVVELQHSIATACWALPHWQNLLACRVNGTQWHEEKAAHHWSKNHCWIQLELEGVEGGITLEPVCCLGLPALSLAINPKQNGSTQARTGDLSRVRRTD